MIEIIKHEQLQLAIIIRRGYSANGIEFFTPPDYSQQLGIMRRPKNYKIPPHLHKPVSRLVSYTKEVLFIKYGKVEVDFYSEDKEFLKSTVLVDGDCILLARGGHGFTMLEESELIEVKQGPYAGDDDKERF